MRLDVKYRSDAGGRTVAVTHAVSGSGNATLPLASSYSGLASLCSTLQAHLRLVDDDIRCSESGGVVTINDLNGHTFALTWTHPRLRDWLGFSGNLTGGSTYTGSVSPGTLIGQYRWASGQPLAICWYTRTFTGDHQTGGSVKLGKRHKWEVDVLIGPDDLASFRQVISYAMRGYGLRWWRDVDVAGAWSYSNWWGYLDVRLQPDWRSYNDNWEDPITQLQLRTTLALMVEG